MHYYRFLLISAALLINLQATEKSSREQIAELVAGHHWAAVRPLLEQAVTGDPKDSEAHYYLGLTLLNQNKPEEAVAQLENATTLAPINSEYQRVLGDAYGSVAQQAGMLSKMSWAKKCKAAYLRAIEIDPRNIGARMSVMEYYRQAPGFVGGGMDQAYAQAEEIKKLDAVQGRVALASLYVSDKKYREAFALYEAIIKDQPDDYDSLYALGRITALTGENLDAGLVALRHCLALTSTGSHPSKAPANWRIGTILELKGDKMAARAAYESSLKIDPAFKQASESLKRLN